MQIIFCHEIKMRGQLHRCENYIRGWMVLTPARKWRRNEKFLTSARIKVRLFLHAVPVCVRERERDKSRHVDSRLWEFLKKVNTLLSLHR